MFSRIATIIRKEFLHIIRDPRSLGITVILPVFLLVLFGYAVSFDVKHLPLAVFDQDKYAASREFVSRFTQSGYFDLVEELKASAQFSECLDSGRAKVVFDIPPDFSRKVAAGKKAEVQVILDGSDPTVASSALSYVASIGEEYSRDLVAKSFGSNLQSPITLSPRIWYNENLRSLNFFIPGLICIILMMMSATLTSLTIVSEKEKGTMESLVVSPIKKNELMLGKVLPYVLIALIDVLLVTLVGSLWFHVPIKGSIVLLFVSSIFFLVSAMGIGLLISASAKSGQEAMIIALIGTMLPSVLLSDFVFPIENMPWILQGLTYLIPARYFLKILRGIFLKGIGLSYLWWELLLLFAFGIIVVALSTRKFKKRIE